MIRRHSTPSEGATTQTTTAGVTGLRHRIAEASGKVAADCAALCCCCPCSVMNLVALAVYRVPAGLCRRVAGKRRRRVTARKRRGVSGGGAGNGQARPSEGEVDGEDSVVELLRKAREEGGGGAGGDAAEQSLEQEMWERFSRTGFWRRPSTKVSKKFPVSHVLATNQLERSCKELLEAVERERSFRFNPSRNATIFHHPALGDFEFQHLPAGATDAELEERIIQHLAAAAAMGQARHIARREGHRNRSMAHGRSHVLVFTHPNAPLSGSTISPPARPGEDDQTREVTIVSPSSPLITVGEERPLIAPSISPQVEQALPSARSVPVNQQSSPQNNRSPNQSSPSSQERGGPSDFQSFSENLKNRFNSVSNRCKESLSKSTRGWRERLFSRNTSITDLGTEVRREVNAGIASVSCMMERLETRDRSRTSSDSISNSVESIPARESGNSQTAEVVTVNIVSEKATSSASAC